MVWAQNKCHIWTQYPWNPLHRLLWWPYMGEVSCRAVFSVDYTLKNQIFPVENSNLWSSVLVANISSVFKTGQIWSLLYSHSRFWVSFNLLSPRRLIFRLHKSLVSPAPPLSNFFDTFELSAWLGDNLQYLPVFQMPLSTKSVTVSHQDTCASHSFLKNIFTLYYITYITGVIIMTCKKKGKIKDVLDFWLPSVDCWELSNKI